MVIIRLKDGVYRLPMKYKDRIKILDYPNRDYQILNDLEDERYDEFSSEWDKIVFAICHALGYTKEEYEEYGNSDKARVWIARGAEDGSSIVLTDECPEKLSTKVLMESKYVEGELIGVQVNAPGIILILNEMYED